MEPETTENNHYKFELHRLIKDDEISSISTGISSDPFLDEHIIITSTPNPEELPEENADNDISYSILYGKEIDESKEMGDDIDLYSDLVKIEEEERKAKQKHEIEFRNIKKELIKLRESEARSTKRIEQLTTENANLMISISSLYRTVKREIDFKDKLLAEAHSKNRKLTNFMYYNNKPDSNEGKCPYCQRSFADEKTDKNFHKRKRSISPEPSNKKREYKSSTSKICSDSDLTVDKNAKNTKKEFKSSALKMSNDSNLISEKIKNSEEEFKKMQETNDASNLLIVKDCKNTKNEYKPGTSKTNDNSYLPVDKDSKNSMLECNPSSSRTANDVDLSLNKHKPNTLQSLVSKVDVKHDKEKQSDNQCVLYQPPQTSSTENSCDSIDASNVLFNMLPEALKNSFYECEQNQITSLNRLKQTLINEYFAFGASSKSSASGSIPRGLNENCEIVSKVNTEPLSTTNSELQNETNLLERFVKHELQEKVPETTKKDTTKNYAHKVVKNCYTARSIKKDVATLFMYRKEKMPFSEKRKFGLHKSGKKPHS